MAGEEGGRGKAFDATCIATGLDPDRIGRNTRATRNTVQLDPAFSAVDVENIGRMRRRYAGKVGMLASDYRLELRMARPDQRRRYALRPPPNITAIPVLAVSRRRSCSTIGSSTAAPRPEQRSIGLAAVHVR